ncbi:MAG: LytTR family DNA-binding domain-containing protein [Pelobium sp.]
MNTRLKRILSVLSHLLMAFFTANYILIIPQKRPLVQLLHLKGFYIALLFSTLLAFLFIRLSVWIHRQLNFFYPWELHTYKRLLLQVVLGVGLVLALDLALVWLYFMYYHQDFWNSRYLRIEAQIVLFMLLIFHFLMIGFDLLREKIALRNLRNQEQEFVHFVYGNKGPKKLKIGLDEVICFYNESHIGHAHLINNEVWNTDYTLQTLEGKLSPQFGFRINRCMLVNWQAIKAYESITNMQGKVILKYQLEPGLKVKISRERFKNFKLLYGTQKS